jgi:hypothetical protein
MTRKRAFAAACTLVVLMVPSTAPGHHLAEDVPDNSNPDSIVRDGQVCSASGINAPITNNQKTLNGWNYWLRYSTNCRSIWGRSSNQAPRRTDLATNRKADSEWGGFCTGNTHYSGDTWYWTGQVDDAGHEARTRIDNSGHNCSGSYSWLSGLY